MVRRKKADEKAEKASTTVGKSTRICKQLKFVRVSQRKKDEGKQWTVEKSIKGGGSRTGTLRVDEGGLTPFSDSAKEGGVSPAS